MKRILVTGNLGYVGSAVVKFLKLQNPKSKIFGFDSGFFISNIIHTGRPSETFLDAQFYGDTRNFPFDILNDIDVVIHLAAVSNDPIGNKFEEVTNDINYLASVELAKESKNRGVKNFVFASSCSIYGKGGNDLKTENDIPNPLTAYAKSKIMTEEKLDLIANDNFIVTSLRFATACGYSERLRLDLVLNDFVASAVSSGKIDILSDGMPWRPLIYVKDMAKAINWASQRSLSKGGAHLIVNTGYNNWNYRIFELGDLIKTYLPNVKVEVAKKAQNDDRSYRVNFQLFDELTKKDFYGSNIKDVIIELYKGLRVINFDDDNFRNSSLCRLVKVQSMRDNKSMNNKLMWN